MEKLETLQRLDEALFELRHTFRAVRYRNYLLRGVAGRVELSTVRLLRAVQRSESDPSIGEVADLLNITPSTASRQVEQSVDSGFLVAGADDRDRRRSVLRLTSRGTSLLEDINQRRRQLLLEATDTWTEVALIELARLTERLSDDLRARTER